MSVYGASATRDRQAWLFGLTGPQFFLVLAAGFPTWMAIAIGQCSRCWASSRCGGAWLRY